MTLQHITIRNTTFMVDDDVPSWPDFWSRVEQGVWEPEIFELMDRVLTPEWRWVDIGAWIGPTALYAAHKGARVDAYECDPVALKALRTNVALNDRPITIYDFALGDCDRASVLMWSDQFGNSESSFQRKARDQDYTLVEVRDALTIFKEKGYASDPRTIVKMDVEGSEFVILPRLKEVMKDARCIWVVSVHGEHNHMPLTFRTV